MDIYVKDLVKKIKENPQVNNNEFYSDGGRLKYIEGLNAEIEINAQQLDELEDVNHSTCI